MSEQEQGDGFRDAIYNVEPDEGDNRSGEGFVIWLLITFAFVVGMAIGALLAIPRPPH